MARKKTRRRKTAKRKTSKRKPRRTAAQKRATANLVALNKARRGGRKVVKRKASGKKKGSHHTTPALPSLFSRNPHTAVTVRPRSRHGSHHPQAQTVRIKPRRDVGHEFYD